jgi:hypothetical protein
MLLMHNALDVVAILHCSCCGTARTTLVAVRASHAPHAQHCSATRCSCCASARTSVSPLLRPVRPRAAHCSCCGAPRTSACMYSPAPIHYDVVRRSARARLRVSSSSPHTPSQPARRPLHASGAKASLMARADFCGISLTVPASFAPTPWIDPAICHHASTRRQPSTAQQLRVCMRTRTRPHTERSADNTQEEHRQHTRGASERGAHMPCIEASLELEQRIETAEALRSCLFLSATQQRMEGMAHVVEQVNAPVIGHACMTPSWQRRRCAGTQRRANRRSIVHL